MKKILLGVVAALALSTGCTVSVQPQLPIPAPSTSRPPVVVQPSNELTYADMKSRLQKLGIIVTDRAADECVSVGYGTDYVLAVTACGGIDKLETSVHELDKDIFVSYVIGTNWVIAAATDDAAYAAQTLFGGEVKEL